MHCKLWDDHPQFWEIALSFTKIHHHISFSCPYTESHALVCLQHPGWCRHEPSELWSLAPSAAPGSYCVQLLNCCCYWRQQDHCLHWKMGDVWVTSSTPSCVHQPPTHEGMYKLSQKKERKQPPEQPLPPSTPTLAQQVQKLPGEQKVLSFVNAATPLRRFWWGKRSRHPICHSLLFTQPSLGPSGPNRTPAVTISLCALSTDNLSCLGGAEATTPLATPQGWFSLNCGFLGSPCVWSNIAAFRGSLPCFPK